MAITDTQKIDYLFKKLGFGVTKTDENSIKVAANESIPSPLLLRGDKVWQRADAIPAVKPTANTDVVEIYTGSNTVECNEDITSTPSRTWKTNLLDWIPPELGSTYIVNVYLHDSLDAANAELDGTKLFVTGSGNNDEWFFDYQSGVLHFIGTNLPASVGSANKSIYITGARYVGPFGVGSAAGQDADIGNLIVSDTTISSVNADASIILDPNGSGQLIIEGTNAVTIPAGTTAQRPSGSTGDIRINSDTGSLEFYDGSDWKIITPLQDTNLFDNFNGDDLTTQFTLTQDAVSTSVLITLNGVIQSPVTAYSVSGNTLTFNEAPATGDNIEVRYVASSLSPWTTILDNDTYIIVNDLAGEITSSINGNNVIVSTETETIFNSNVEPSADATHNLGSTTSRWNNVYTTDLHLSNENKENGNDIDGTTGNWTIQEGESDLFVINNITGKKYKIMLSEVG